MHQDLKKLPITHNTCTPSWQGIPSALQQYILDFLSPIEALPCISTYKDSLNDCGQYIIKRFHREKLAYHIISPSHSDTVALLILIC